MDITYSGDITQYDCSPLTMALVKGVLAPILKETVNFVNATALARERGINVKEGKSSIEQEFAHLIEVKLVTDKETRIICGTLSANKQPRIVKIDGYYVEVSIFGEMVFIKNWDKPGIIGNLGTFMGKQNINIAAMTFGRTEQGGKAISVLSVDSPVSPVMLEQIKKIENVLEAKVIRV
jgi:D-3-phosphoglycerate dehydrogenase